MRRYIGLEVLAKSRLTLIDSDPGNNSTPQEVTTTALSA